MVQVKNMKQRSYIMLYFENDYCEGAHEAILKRLMETNMEKVDRKSTRLNSSHSV